jgi:hypothetical protein
MLIKYRQGFSNHLDRFNPVLISLTAFAAGYTINDFPERFKNWFTNPLGQFLVYFLIIYVTYRSDKEVTISEMIGEAIIYVIILQMLKMVLVATLE